MSGRALSAPPPPYQLIGSTSDEKRGFQHFTNKKHTFKRKGLKASDKKRGLSVSKTRNTTLKSKRGSTSMKKRFSAFHR
jgi:hypothetical protein